MVPQEGVEPSRPFGHCHLKTARLPISPSGRAWDWDWRSPRIPTQQPSVSTCCAWPSGMKRTATLSSSALTGRSRAPTPADCLVLRRPFIEEGHSSIRAGDQIRTGHLTITSRVHFHVCFSGVSWWGRWGLNPRVPATLSASYKDEEIRPFGNHGQATSQALGIFFSA